MCENTDFIFRLFVLQFWESSSGNLKYMYGENQTGVTSLCIVNKRSVVYYKKNYENKKREAHVHFTPRSKQVFKIIHKCHII